MNQDLYTSVVPIPIPFKTSTCMRPDNGALDSTSSTNLVTSYTPCHPHWFSTAAITNYHNLSLKPHKCIISHFYRSDAQSLWGSNQSSGQQEVLGEIRFQAHSGCWQNPVLCECRTGVLFPVLVVSQGPPLAPKVQFWSCQVNSYASGPATATKSFPDLESAPLLSISLLALSSKTKVPWVHMEEPG